MTFWIYEGHTISICVSAAPFKHTPCTLASTGGILVWDRRKSNGSLQQKLYYYSTLVYPSAGRHCLLLPALPEWRKVGTHTQHVSELLEIWWMMRKHIPTCAHARMHAHTHTTISICWGPAHTTVCSGRGIRQHLRTCLPTFLIASCSFVIPSSSSSALW